MKKTLFICLLILLNVSLFAQEKAALTKEETINYIQKNSKIPIRKWAATPSLQVVPQAGNDLNAY